MARVFEESFTSSKTHHRHYMASPDKKVLAQKTVQKKVQGMRQKKLRKKNDQGTTSMSGQ